MNARQVVEDHDVLSGHPAETVAKHVLELAKWSHSEWFTEKYCPHYGLFAAIIREYDVQLQSVKDELRKLLMAEFPESGKLNYDVWSAAS
jgi:hypothetical protein